MKQVVLHLSLIPHVGPGVFERISRVLPHDRLDELYRWSLQDFIHRTGFSEKTAGFLIEGLFDKKVLEEELALIKKHNVRWVTIIEDDYPVLLRHTTLPPLVVYWRGADLTILENGIAMVGSRLANSYGKKVIDQLVPELMAHDFCLVSGGALGADTMAHEAALLAQGKTCAVIGSGLLRPYPASNRNLFEAIVKSGGIVMSHFPLRTQAFPGNFPARNRIISGLCPLTIVIQAAQKSGALITASYALEQGREVCAVPGPIDDPLSEGCHFLLKEGAALVQSAQDLLRLCGIDNQSGPQMAIPLRPSQDPLLDACIVPQMFDDLRLLLGYDEMQLQEKLVTLQLEGVLEQDIMGRWYLVR